MSLQDRLDALKSVLASKVSTEAQTTMDRATQAIKSSGIASRAVKVGQTAPSFVLPDANGLTVRSDEYLERGALVISFYRGLWCPYCNIELEALQETVADIRAAGAELIVISPQTAANSRRSARVASLDFPILIDKGNGVAAEFGLRFALSADLIELYKSFGNNLVVVNGDDTWTLPMPARFVVDSTGIVQYAEINPDYAVRPDPRVLLPVLESIGRAVTTSK